MPSAAVDVLVPTRGRPASLELALASIDRTAAAEPDLDVRVHVLDAAPEGLGPAAARNAAARLGDAPYLALLDDDDAWVAPRLGPAIELLDTRPEIALTAGDAALSSGGRFLPLPPTPGESRDHGALALDCSVCTSTVTLRRTDWEAAGGMDESLDRAEDYDLWLRLTADGRRVGLLPGTLAEYDDSGAGLSGDPVAMARATLAALSRSARMPERDPVWRDRRGRLHGVVAHGLVKEGRFDEARAEARLALELAPTARVAWTSMTRAVLRLRR
ncbi:MAG: glycosyltransferase [Proteobacteria bacterium]|nr:glycosyltransferase [Pseudomonadota bacterium]